VRTLSAKGTIIARETPSNIAEKTIHTVAMEKMPRYGRINLSNFK